MKKIAIALLTILSIISVSCQIGLGAAVDTEPPALTIQNPPIDSVIRDDFAIVGTYSDDGKIESVVAQVERTDGSGYSETFTGVLNGKIKARTEGTYTIVIPAKTSKITDGSYQAIVTIKDETGRTTIRNTTFTIDNTPPVIVLQRPGTDINATLSDADTYGQLLTLEGLGADDNNIDHINVDIYGDKAKTDYKTTVTLNNVPPSISLDVAKYGDEAYKKIYGDVAPADFIPQQYYCSITAFDGAQRYPADGSEQTAADLLGNPTSDYYIYEEISNSVLKQAKVTDIYHILNGSFGLDSSRSSGIDTAAILDTLALKKKTVGSFVLDPKNNPTYSIAGKPTLIAGENAECLKLDSDYTVSNDSDITVQVNIGLDNSPIVNDDNFKVYFQKCKFENGKYVGYGDLIEAPVVANGKKKIGSNYQFTVNVKSSANGLEVEKPYLVIVNGKDENNQPIVSANNGYGFYLVSLSSAPTLKDIIPSDATVYVKEDGDLTIKGVTRLTEGKPVVSIRCNEIVWDSKTVTDADLVDGKTDEYNFEITIPNSTFKAKADKKADGTSPASTEFALEIRSSNGDDKSTSTYKTVYFDVDNPEVNEVSITPEINTTEPLLLNGEISVTGLVEDKFSGVKGWKYQVWEKNATAPSRESAFQTQSRVSFTYDTTLIEDLSEIDIKILAEDKAGNEYPKVIACKIDQSTDKPKFEAQDGVTWEAGILNPYYINAHAADVQSKNIISGGISSKITDDDSVAYVLFEVQAVKPKTEVSEENKADPAYAGYDADATATANLESSERYALYKKTGKEVSVTHKMPGTTGFYFITQTAYDKNFKFGADLSTLQESAIPSAITTAEANAENKNYFTKKTYVVKIPGTGPQYTLTQDTKYVSEYQKNNSKTVKVTINIENGEAPYTFKRNGEAITTINKINDNTYEDEIQVGSIYKADGDIVVTYAITDANDTTKKTVQYYRDNVKPTFTKAKLETESEKYSVFNKSGYYYLNNINQNFTVSGQASDSVSGVETINLEIINVNASGTKINTSRVIKDSDKTGFFDEIEFANYEYEEDGTTIKKRNYWQHGAKITVTVTDAAGNISDETIFNVKFDTQGPNGVHVMDKSTAKDENGAPIPAPKDLYFRIGDQSRDDYVEKDAIEEVILDENGNGTAISNGTAQDGTVTYGVPDWEEKDKDVGGKYSGNTYGNAETVKLRGKFEDKVSDEENAAEGSGVNLIYYKVFTTQPNDTNNFAANFLVNYKTQADGYFSLLKTAETRRVFYTDDSTGTNEGKLGGTFNPVNGGTVTVTKGSEAKKKYYTDITTNYKTTIANLSAGENYLVLVAVDNVGNAALEGVEYNGEFYSDYRINVDYESPSISSNAPAIGLFTNASEALEIKGTVKDNPATNNAGISSVWLKYDDNKEHWIKASVEGENWTAIVSKDTLITLYGSSDSPKSVLFTATATDKSGKGNTASCNVSVTIDKTPPTVEVSVAEKSNAGTKDEDVPYVNGSIKLKGTASDTNGLKEGETIKLYYITDASEKNGVTAISKWTPYEATTISSNNEWTLNTSVSPFTDGTTYYFTVAATDKAGNTGYAAPLALAVNKDSDRPTVKFYMNFGEDVNAISLDKAELDGVISDDDGTPHADKVWYYISYDTKNSSGAIVSGDNAPANNAWIPYNSSNITVFKYNASTGSFSFKPNDGTAYIWLKIQDNGDGEFISSNSTTYNFNTPVITDQNGDKVLGSKPATGTTVEAVPRLKLKKDTVAPLTDSFAYLAKGMDSTKEAQANNGNGWSSNTGSAVFGGTEANTFKVRIYAYDVNGISSVKFKLPMNENDPKDKKDTAIQDENDATKSYYEYALTSQGVSKQKEINNNTYDLYWSGDIDVTGLASGQRSCIIDVSDGTKHKTEPISFVIDNTAPTATVTSHNRNDQVGASFLLKGSFEDGGANQTLKYYLSADSTAPDKDDDLWDNKEEVKGVTAISWNVYFDGASSDSETTHDKLPKQIVADLISNVIIASSGENINKAVYETEVSGHAAGSLYRNIETVYFHLLAIDSIGNRGVSTFALKMDPQGDIPTIKMSYPAYPIKEENKNYFDGTTVEYAKLNGIIRAQGSAEDDKNIVGIYMQIDPAYVHANGFDEDNWSTKECPGKTSTKTSLSDFYTVEDMYTSYNTYQTEHNGAGHKTGGPLGIKVGTSPSWNISLNKDGEFNESGDNNFIAIRFFAVDEDGNISDWTDDDLFIISVDSNAPKIGSSEPLYLYQYGFKDSSGDVYYATSATPQNGAQLYSDSGCRTAVSGKTYSSSYTAAIVSQQYQDDMWLNGEWWLSGSVEDESGISVLNIREMQSDGSYGDYQDIKASSTSKTFTAAGTSGYVINYRVGSIDTNPGYGKLEYTIYAKDELDDDGKDTEAEIKLKYDNKSPTLAASGDDDYSIPVDVVNDQGFYKVQSVVTELKDESGFDKVIFYFKRGTTVFDSYMPKSISGISSGLVNDSDIYWKSNTVTAVSGNVITVSADSNIHIGGLVKVGGVIYTITGMNTAGTEITLDGNPASSVNGSQALFAIGHVVDHVGTETEGTKGGKISATAENPTPYGLGYYGDIPDDDGDLMLEKVSTASTKTLWYGLINSRNVPDGAIEIRYVAFDKAGNMSHGSVTNAYVKNNGPRLASLRVWTDYNGNGSGDTDVTDETSAAHKEYESENEVKYYSRRDRKIGGKTVSRATAVTDNLIVTGNDLGIEENASAFMRVTDQTKFYPEIIGGNGDLYYSYRIGSGATNAGNYSVTWPATGLGIGNGGNTPFAGENRTGYKEYSDVSADFMLNDENTESYVQGASSNPIPVSTDILGAVNNGLKWFEYTIWDSTAEGTVYTDTLNAKFTVLLNVAYADTSAPKAVISPFFWKSKSENSLYGNSKDNGHIELEKDLAGTVAEELYGSDPKVSGKITIRGTAYDDIRLKELWVKFDDIAALTGTASQTATSGYVQAATYTKSTATWTPTTATMAGNGWEFTATNVYCNKDGHLVNWELSINTANVKNGNTVAAAAINKKAYVMALDDRGNLYSSTTASGTAPANGDYSNAAVTYNNPFYQMDIVPYITAIKTTNRTKSGLKDNNIRSASGKYSVIKGTTADFITVEGFNLNVSDARIVTEARRSALTTAWTDADITLTPTSKATDFTSFKGRNNLSKSGYLEVLVNGVRAMNNINNDNAYGTAKNASGVQLTSANAAVTDFENAYNREPDYYTTKNVQLTDDRYIRVFDMKDTGIKNGYYPVMMMGLKTENQQLVTSDNPVFGYVDLNGMNNSVSTFNCFEINGTPINAPQYMVQRAEFSSTTGKTSDIEYLIGGMTWDQMAMSRDSKGKYMHVSVFNQNKASMTFVYDRYAEITQYKLFGQDRYTYYDGWGGGSRWTNWTTYVDRDDTTNGKATLSQSLGNNAINLETVGFDETNPSDGESNLVGRYQGMKMKTTGDSTTTAGAINYLAYYDDNTANSNIIFRTFRVRTQANNSLGNAMTGNLSSNLPEGDKSGRITAASNATKYLDLGVTSDGHAVIVYYDKDGSMKLVHSNAAVDGSITGTTFSATNVSFTSYIGQYLSMAIDANDHIHIAAFDANKSTLRYIYLDSYSDTTPDEYTVDASTSVGKWTQIKIHNGKPYIAYYNNAEDGQKESIRLAYLTAATVADGYDASGYATGAWEYMTVPSLSPAQGGDAKFQSVCLDFDSAGRPVVGYLGTNLEFGKWLDE